MNLTQPTTLPSILNHSADSRPKNVLYHLACLCRTATLPSVIPGQFEGGWKVSKRAAVGDGVGAPVRV